MDLVTIWSTDVLPYVYPGYNREDKHLKGTLRGSHWLANKIHKETSCPMYINSLLLEDYMNISYPNLLLSCLLPFLPPTVLKLFSHCDICDI